jgi:hypothetical protein
MIIYSRALEEKNHLTFFLYDSCGIFVHLAINELRFVNIEHDALQRQLEIRRSIFKKKWNMLW